MAKVPTRKEQVATLSDFSREELSFLLENLDKMPLSEQEFLLRALEGDAEADRVNECQESLMPFMNTVEPKYIYGAHHRKIASVLEEVVRGEKTRVIINIAPRFGKSEMASYLFPAWFIGKFPDKKIIIASHTAELATNFGRKVRNLMDTPEYRGVFPEVRLSVDSKAAGRWATNEGGEFFAAGVGGALAGRGGDLILIDDPISEQQAKSGNTQAYLDQWEWFQQGLMTRLMPGGRLIVLMCVEENQRVLMADGRWKPIKDIRVGEFVAAHEDGRSVGKKVLNTVTQGEDDLLEVVTRSTSLKTNARHPYLVVRGGCDASPKTQEDVVVSRGWTLEWVPAGKLQAGDMVVTSKELKQKGHVRPPCPTRKQMTQEDYWLFGFLVGDGWIIRSKTRGNVGIAIALSKYPELNTRVIEAAESCFGVTFNQTRFGYIRADNKLAAAWLAARGIGFGAKLKRVPEWVFRLRACDKRAFLRGFLAADGWLRPAKREVETYTSCLANRELLDDLRLLSRTCGVKTTKIYAYAFDAHAPNSPVPTKAVNYSAQFSFRENMNELGSRYRYQSPYRNGKQFFRFERVEKIVPAGRGTVIDITVDGAENFIAEGIVVHNTRWSALDLTGQIVNHMNKNPDADQWEVIELPAVLPSGASLWPEFWPVEELEKKRISVGPAAWAAQYLQQPTSEGAQILKSEWWRNWDKDEPPECVYTVMSLDAAQEAHNRADYSAVTLWGVFYVDGADGRKMTNVILLNAWKDRLEFPDLKRAVLADYKKWKPDTFVVEKKSNGAALYQELRRMDIAVTEFTPSRGQDKIARVNAISDMFASGMIWAPLDRRWAQEVSMECAEFPLGANDDYVDSASCALIRIRQGGFLTLPSDYEDNELPEFRHKSRGYY